MPTEKRPLKVFLSHAHSDAETVRALYERLTADGVDAWLDKEKLLPGQDWELEIRKGVRAADVVVVCLSKVFNQAGYRQKEVRIALDEAQMQPEGTIFIIPARLEECENLESLRKWHWVDLFEEDGYKLLMRALRMRARNIGAELQSKRSAISDIFKKPSAKRQQKQKTGTPRIKKKKAVESEKKSIVPQPKSTTSSQVKKRKPVKTGIIVAVIGLVATIWVALIGLGGPMVEKWFAASPKPTATAALNVPSSTVPPAALPTRTFIPELTPTKMVTLTATPYPTEISDIDPSGNPIAMRLVPAGEFTMGSKNGDSDEKPEHQVSLEAFYLDKYEVTNSLYKACVDAGVCKEPGNTSRYNKTSYENHPVVYVDWNQAKTYCEWRSGDLPSEAQWEKAARGTDGRTYPWGEEIDCNKANYGGCLNDTAEVGSYESGRSPYGLYDMAGNVWEWVADWYDSDYYEKSPSSNPLGPNSGQYRVLRGGSWIISENGARASYRNGYNLGSYDFNLGFRCFRSRL